MSNRLVAVFTPFERLTDPRIERTRVHDLFELVVVALCGTIAGADTWADIERFGNGRLEWLRTFLRLEEGIPSHDTFGRVFSLLDPAELLVAFSSGSKRLVARSASTLPSMARPCAARSIKRPAAIRCTWFRLG